MAVRDCQIPGSWELGALGVVLMVHQGMVSASSWVGTSVNSVSVIKRYESLDLQSETNVGE